jgi:hypothetical protein
VEQEDMIHFFANSEQLTAFLRGFDTLRQQTKQACIKGPARIETTAGSPAVSDFEYVHSVEEVFNRENTSVEVRAAIRYATVSAGADVRHDVTRKSMQNMEYGAVHGYFEKIDGAEIVKNRRFKLTRAAQRLHDRAVRERNMELFYDACGDAIIVGKQRGSYFKAIGTFQFNGSMSHDSKATDVGVWAKYSGLMVGASVAARVAFERENKKTFESTQLRVRAEWSGESCVDNPTDLESLKTAFAQYNRCPRTDDLLSIRVVPYAKVVDGFGKLGDVAGVDDRQRDKVAVIMNGLSLYEQAMVDLSSSSDAWASTARAQIEKNYIPALNLFKQSKACLGKFTLGCRNLHRKFEQFPAFSGRATDKFVNRMLAGQKACRKVTAVPIVNGHGRITCRVCGQDEVPLFINNKNGKCGLLAPKTAKSTLRFTRMDLSEDRMMGGSEAGVSQLVSIAPDACARRNKTCGPRRANAICKQQGFAKARQWHVRYYSPTTFANGKPCIQSIENGKPSQYKCRTYKWIDCACPRGQVLQPGKKRCVDLGDIQAIEAISGFRIDR